MAVIRVPIPVITIVGVDQLNRVEIIYSSPNRLIVGGMAMLVKLIRSHQVDINGKASCRPRTRRSVRVCVRS